MRRWVKAGVVVGVMGMEVTSLAPKAFASRETFNQSIAQAYAIAQGQAAPWSTHIESDLYSFQHPMDAVVESTGEGTVEVKPLPTVATNRAIHTEVALFRENPGNVVNQHLDEFREASVLVRRYRVMMVDEQSALRMWLGDQPGDLNFAIATFVGYGDGATVVLISRYAEDNPEAEATIHELHGSLQGLSLLEMESESTDSEPAPADPVD